MKVSVKSKSSHYLFVLLSDGSVFGIYIANGSFEGPTRLGSADPQHGSETFSDLVGDALYALSNQAIFVSRDSARTWQPDTAGVGGGTYYQVALDTNQYVYAAHSTGLYRQHPDSNVWRKVTTYPTPNSLVAAVFVDRMNRLFARSSVNVYKSTDNGVTWSLDTVGIRLQNIAGFCDDRYGNVYAWTGSAVWRSTGGTSSWVRIDQPLQAYINDPSAFLYRSFISKVSGDSLLRAATVLGGSLSNDQGATWYVDSSGVPARFIYGFVKTSSGKLLASTNLGVYARNPSDTVWKKTLPANGYFSGSPVYADRNGNAYALGKRINSADVISMSSNWKSTDGGLTWSADTAGLGAIGRGQSQIYFVDETGIQHFGSYDAPATLYSKTAGGSWTPDTTGFGQGGSTYPFALFTDKAGFVYASVQNKATYSTSFLKRPVAGGTWVPDTNGLNTAAVYSLAVDKSGNLIAGTYTGLYRRVGGTWSRVSHPAGREGYSAFVVSIDSSGALLAGFSTFSGYSALWRGVYATTDNGSHWTSLGLDSISVRGLASYGDTTYAYTYANGVYLLRSTTGGTFVNDKADVVQEFSLSQNYPNPFNPTTVIEFSIPARPAGGAKSSIAKLQIFDLLGREVTTLVDEDKPAGTYRVSFDASKLSSGVYYYTLKAGSTLETRKMILAK